MVIGRYSFGDLVPNTLPAETRSGVGAFASDGSRVKGTAHDNSTSRIYENLDQWPEHHALSRSAQVRT
jgi:hypothetical protein